MPASATHVTPDTFRDAIGHFASGVTVITAAHGGQRFGATASAVSSLSLEPPMLLVCLNRESATGRLATTPCRITFRKFPALAAFDLSVDLEMDSSEAAAAGCLITIDLKEAGVDPARALAAAPEKVSSDVDKPVPLKLGLAAK